MNGVVEDEKKPLDALNAPEEGDTHPDPDEEMLLEQGQGKVWLVKIPKFLMERWAAVDEDDKHLATIRIYEGEPNDPNRKHKIILFLPPNQDPVNVEGSYHSLEGAPSPAHSAPTPPGSLPPSQSQTLASQQPRGPSLIHPHITNWPPFDQYATNPTTGSDPDIYELEMVNDNVENQIVVANRQRDRPYAQPNAPYNPRARMVILTGRIKHEVNVRPAFSSTYRRQMRERHKKYNTPLRKTLYMDPKEIPGGQGRINRLTAGVGIGGKGFGTMVKPKAKPGKGQNERYARMPRNQLLDELFAAFRDQERWTIKVLREKTQQPEAYLKEVMSEIAFLHRSGEFNGLWELKANYKDTSFSSGDVPVPLGMTGDFKMEDGDDDDEDEDDDDEDMEEVS
ncbi:transcription initiation factor IIF, beta subunit [Ephemerocybe angulata]|uniref:Transcription initiation factor IIF subunit beta n=1 Tax=Ephemerocybe angulata TaxID=980116 RepID=A0A8H6MA84_9AGAR|nr:transcription initiation factor IIF, beta subunit [Tulosesus angulatus]